MQPCHAELDSASNHQIAGQARNDKNLKWLQLNLNLVHATNWKHTLFLRINFVDKKYLCQA